MRPRGRRGWRLCSCAMHLLTEPGDFRPRWHCVFINVWHPWNHICGYHMVGQNGNRIGEIWAGTSAESWGQKPKAINSWWPDKYLLCGKKYRLPVKCFCPRSKKKIKNRKVENTLTTLIKKKNLDRIYNTADWNEHIHIAINMSSFQFNLQY